MGIYSLLDQGFLYHGFDEIVNCFVGKVLAWPMLSQGLEGGMGRISPVPKVARQGSFVRKSPVYRTAIFVVSPPDFTAETEVSSTGFYGQRIA